LDLTKSKAETKTGFLQVKMRRNPGGRDGGGKGGRGGTIIPIAPRGSGWRLHAGPGAWKGERTSLTYGTRKGGGHTNESQVTKTTTGKGGGKEI